MRSTADMTTTHTIMTPDFKTMTPAQQKRLGELMMRDIALLTESNLDRLKYQSANLRSNFPHLNVPCVPTANPASFDDLINRIEETQRKRAELFEDLIIARNNELFSREELFRFAYVPFVIAELVWDYADTVIILSQNIGNSATRRLSRTIRKARADYEYERRKCVDDEQREREIQNGYVFEDATKDITDEMLKHLRNDIESEYPDLLDDSRDLLLAVYQCHITSRALLRYLDRQSERVAKRAGHAIGKMMPKSYYLMDKLIPEFIGNKPASANFRKSMNDYIERYAVEMERIEMNDIDENQQQTPKQQTTMTNIELFNKIQSVMASFNTDLDKNIIKGNKAAGVRARKASLELEKLMKQYRKQSVK